MTVVLGLLAIYGGMFLLTQKVAPVARERLGLLDTWHDLVAPTPAPP